MIRTGGNPVVRDYVIRDRNLTGVVEHNFGPSLYGVDFGDSDDFGDS